MECHHCNEKFEDKEKFDSHLIFHLNVQKELSRPKDRSYGARYVSAKKKATTQAPGTSQNSYRPPESPTSKENATPRDARTSSKRTSPPSSPPSGDLILAMDDRSTPRTANWAERSPEAVRGLQRVLDKYPAFPERADGPQLDSSLSTATDSTCRHCSAIFSHLNDLNNHYLSKECHGVSAIIHLMIYDSSKVGNYRLEMRLIPFDHKTDQLEFQCRKCETCFETEAEADEHELTHPNEGLHCPHCKKAFSTSHELDQHYEFHDDMAFRHKRDRIRAGEPDDAEEEEARRFLEQPGIERFPLENAGVERIPRKDGDLIAIGFISGDDLERVHAPNGVFKEKSECYYRIPQHLDPDNEPGSVSFRNSELCVTEGRMASFKSSGNSDTNVPAERVAVADGKQSSQFAVNAVEKPSRFRRMLRLAKKNEKSEANSTDEEFCLRRSSTLTELSPPINAGTQQRQSSSTDAATTSRPQSPYPPKDIPKAKPYGISIHGHAVPGRMFIRDESNRTLTTSGELFAVHLFASVVDSASTRPARTEAAHLLTSASASSSRGDLGSAAYAWGSALSILQAHGTLDPGRNFELVVLWELANCLDSMHASLHAELFFHRFLELSYAKSGRESSNNYNAINTLGVLYDNLGRPQEAAEMYIRSIGGRAKLLGPRHHDTAMSLQELGTVYLRLGEYAAARPLFEASLAGFEEGEGPHRNLTLMVMQNLCNVYEGLGLMERLLPLLDQLVDRAPATLGLGNLITGAAVRRWIQYHQHGTNDNDLPDEIKGFVQEYREMYIQSESEVARWVLEVC